MALRRRIGVVVLVAAAAWGGPAEDQFDFAQGLFIAQDYESALEEFAGYLKRFEGGGRSAEAAFRAAECHYRLARHAAAKKAFEAALAAYPEADGAARGWFLLGQCDLALEAHEAAAKAFAASASAAEGRLREEALVGQGEALLGCERFAEAAAVYRGLLAESADSGRSSAVQFSLGWALQKAGDQAAAVTVFEALLAKHPDCAERQRAMLALSDGLMALRRFDDAAALLDRLSGDDGVAAEVALRLAWNRFESGDKGGAAKRFAAFVERFPNHAMVPAARYNAGVAGCESGDFVLAVAQFRALAKAAPDSREASEMGFWFGLSLLETGAAAEAVTVLEAAAETETERRRDGVLYTWGRALARLGRHAEAVAVWRRLLAADGGGAYGARARYGLARSLEALGDLAGAVAVLEEVPGDDPAMAASAGFALGEYRYRLKDLAGARAALEPLAAKEDADERVLYRLGWVYFDGTMYDAAAAVFGRLAGRSERFASEAGYLAARSVELGGDAAAARRAYRAVATGSGAFAEKALYRLAMASDGVDVERILAEYGERFPDGEHRDAVTLKAAEARFGAGDVAGAEQLYRALREAGAEGETGRLAAYGLGWCRVKSGDDPGAAALFAELDDAALATATARDAVLQRGEIAYRAEAFGEGAALFGRLAEVSCAQQARALYMLGWCRVKRGEEDAALAAFRRSLALAPDGAAAEDCAIQAGRILVDAGRTAEARELLAAAVAGGGQRSEALLHRYLDVLVLSGAWKDAIDVAERLLRAFPGSDRAYRAHFQLGLAARAAGVRERAAEHFRATIGATDTIEAARAQFNLAAMAMDAGEYEAAAKGFLRVEMLYDYPELSPKALYHAVQAFSRWEGGRKRGALYGRALQEKYGDSEWAKRAAAEAKEAAAAE